MWPSKLTYQITFILILFYLKSVFTLSDLRKCADPKCQEIISTGKAKITYTADAKGKVSFIINSPIRILSKSSGTDESLWGIQVGGRRGYAPKEYILEDKIYVKEKDLNYEVPVEDFQETVDKTNIKLNPSEVVADQTVKTAENPLTEPLNKDTKATPMSLNAIESGNGTTTAGSLVEDAKIVETIREVVTPVLNSFEVIDGTAIPITEAAVLEEGVKDAVNDNNSKDTKEDVPTTKADRLENNEKTTNEAIANDKPSDTKNEAVVNLPKKEESEKILNDLNKNGNEERRGNDLKDSISSEPEEARVEKEIKKNLEQTEPAEVIKADFIENSLNNTKDVLELSSGEISAGANAALSGSASGNDIVVEKLDGFNGTEDASNDALAKDLPSVEAAVTTTAAIPVESTVTQAATALNDALAKDLTSVETAETTTAAIPVESTVTQAATALNDALAKDLPSVEAAVNTTATTPVESTLTQAATALNNALAKDLPSVEITDTTTAATPVQNTVTQKTTATNNAFLNNSSILKTVDTTTPPTLVENPITQNENTSNDIIPTDDLNLTRTDDSPIATDTFDKPTEANLQSENIHVLVKDSVDTGLFPDLSTKDDNQEDENEDDYEDNDDENDVDDEKRDINVPTASVTSFTTIAPADFTQAGYEANPNKIYWKEEEQVVTMNPHVIVDSTTPNVVTNPGNVEIETSSAPSDSIVTNTLKVETNTVKAKEETSTMKPQMPSLPTTLPLFQKPMLAPSLVNKENHNSQHVALDNKNEQTFQETETKSEEALLKKQIIDSDSSKQKHISESEQSNEIFDANIEVTTQTAKEIEPPVYIPKEEKREVGLFSTILGTVNTFVNKLRKEPTKPESDLDEDLQNILFPDRVGNSMSNPEADEYCEKLSPSQCPQTKYSKQGSLQNEQCHFDWSHINMDNFHQIVLTRAFEMRELLSCLAIAALASLLFLFGYYCFCNTSREGDLISKLNQLERSLLSTHKENLILKDDLLKTRSKLTSIEDTSFGSNDMVMALKKELEVITSEKNQLQQHVNSLEKELETAAEAGLELNKIVAELLNNQSGQESMIMNSVEDLQTQFNEQQKTIFEINANLAEKSRENSELQLMLAEQSVRFNGEIASLQQDNDELEAEKANLQTRIEELKAEFEADITKALEGKNVEIKRLQNEILEVKNRFEDIHSKWQTSLAKIEALEDCMKTMKRDPGIKVNEYINAANIKAELLDLQKQRTALKSQLGTETEARQRAESSLKNCISEVDKLKQEFHQSEKDKLEAQTRLEVLSNYFKEKETQLQKELSLKETIWLKQQGENTSTVDRLTAMQEEIQSLKSQNDALRAEIEAQSAAHKAQTGTLENRAHETWLAARQSERRFEEARAEAAALRRRLTELSGATNATSAVDSKITVTELNNAPSPILPPPLMDTASSPLLGRLPPPQFMPFMGPPPPPPSFLNLPPPPFLSPVEMRPAPLGRMMSPPLGRYSPPPPPPPTAGQRDRNRSDYYDDDYDDSDEDDDDDYDREEYDYDYDDDEDVSRSHRRRRRSGNGSDSWRNRSYSPPPPDRSYRSQSPADSRYNYTGDRDLLSTYDTDHSPPTSPYARGGVSGGNVGGGSGSRTDNYAHTTQSPGPKAPKESTHVQQKSSKGVTNSDSDKSYNSTHHKKEGKSMV